MSDQTLFVRHEPTTDELSLKTGLVHRMDVVAYGDRACTRRITRWAWFQTTKPRGDQALAVLDGTRWKLAWVEDLKLAGIDGLNVTKLEALKSSIKLANNGYLVLEFMRPSDHAFAQEAARAGEVIITNGVVHLPTTRPEFFRTPYPSRGFSLRHQVPDQESAILSRQEQAGFYD